LGLLNVGNFNLSLTGLQPGPTSRQGCYVAWRRPPLLRCATDR